MGVVPVLAVVGTLLLFALPGWTLTRTPVGAACGLVVSSVVNALLVFFLGWNVLLAAVILLALTAGAFRCGAGSLRPPARDRPWRRATPASCSPSPSSCSSSSPCPCHATPPSKRRRFARLPLPDGPRLPDARHVRGLRTPRLAAAGRLPRFRADEQLLPLLRARRLRDADDRRVTWRRSASSPRRISSCPSSSCWRCSRRAACSSRAMGVDRDAARPDRLLVQRRLRLHQVRPLVGHRPPARLRGGVLRSLARLDARLPRRTARGPRARLRLHGLRPVRAGDPCEGPAASGRRDRHPAGRGVRRRRFPRHVVRALLRSHLPRTVDPRARGGVGPGPRGVARAGPRLRDPGRRGPGHRTRERRHAHGRAGASALHDGAEVRRGALPPRARTGAALRARLPGARRTRARCAAGARSASSPDLASSPPSSCSTPTRTSPTSCCASR